jgi:calcineurin-like phosphoesterase family protein
MNGDMPAATPIQRRPLPEPVISARTGLTVAREMFQVLASDPATIPRSDVLWWADLHLNHRLTAAERGFSGVEEQNEIIAAVWDLVVRPDNRVIICGDGSMGGRRNDEYLFDWLSKRPGKVEWIVGNHDAPHPMHRRSGKAQRVWMESGLESVQQSGTYQVGPHRVLGSHFPYRNTPDADHTFEDRFEQWRLTDDGLWLFHGHTHKRDQLVHDRMIHIGLDAHPRGPVTQEWLIAQIDHWEPIYRARELAAA